MAESACFDATNSPKRQRVHSLWSVHTECTRWCVGLGSPDRVSVSAVHGAPGPTGFPVSLIVLGPAVQVTSWGSERGPTYRQSQWYLRSTGVTRQVSRLSAVELHQGAGEASAWHVRVPRWARSPVAGGFDGTILANVVLRVKWSGSVPALARGLLALLELVPEPAE